MPCIPVAGYPHLFRIKLDDHLSQHVLSGRINREYPRVDRSRLGDVPVHSPCHGGTSGVVLRSSSSDF